MGADSKLIGKCISILENEATFQFLYEPDFKLMKNYLVEKADTGTAAQNAAFHALLQEYWKSGHHDRYNAKTFPDFRDCIKRSLGAGFNSYVYADIIDGRPIMTKVDNWSEIPDDIKEFHKIHKDLIRGRLKSWKHYSKKERCETIDRLIAEMDQNGINTKKYQEIRAGMESLKR